MERGMKKLYYVKRQVIASSITEAMRSAGVIYSIEEAEEKDWPVPKALQVGFKPHGKTS